MPGNVVIAAAQNPGSSYQLHAQQCAEGSELHVVQLDVSNEASIHTSVGNFYTAVEDTVTTSQFLHSLLANVEALARGRVDGLDDQSLVLVVQVPAGTAQVGIPSGDILRTADVGEAGERIEGSVACRA